MIVDAAQDVVGAKKLPQDAEGVAIHQVFIVVLQIGELASYLSSKGETVDPVVPEAICARWPQRYETDHASRRWRS